MGGQRSIKRFLRSVFLWIGLMSGLMNGLALVKYPSYRFLIIEAHKRPSRLELLRSVTRFADETQGRFRLTDKRIDSMTTMHRHIKQMTYV